jgi:hypothetical protein
MINKRETKMFLVIVGMVLLVTVIAMSTPIPVLAMGHWNQDGDYVLNTGSDATISSPPSVESAFADHGQGVMPTSKDSQTITNPSIPPQTTMTTTTSSAPVTYISEEICNDGIDNDGDTLIDFSDEQCNTLQSQQRPIVQQEKTMVSTPEVCDDDLDNDFDGNVDGRDEECNSITTSSSFPPPIQEQPVTDDQVGQEEGDEEEEQQSNEDISEESGEKEDGDGEDNKVDGGNNDENENEKEEQQSDDENNNDDDDKEDE